MTVPSAGHMTLIEQLLDTYGLFEVLVAIDVICGDKAAHIRANGGPGDDLLARCWDKAGEAVKRAAKTAAVDVVSP